MSIFFKVYVIGVIEPQHVDIIDGCQGNHSLRSKSESGSQKEYRECYTVSVVPNQARVPRVYLGNV